MRRSVAHHIPALPTTQPTRAPSPLRRRRTRDAAAASSDVADLDETAMATALEAAGDETANDAAETGARRSDAPGSLHPGLAAGALTEATLRALLSCQEQASACAL